MDNNNESRFNYDCEAEYICNDRKIFPAMRKLVEEEGMSINAAAKFVHTDSGRKVTKERARNVYRKRMPDRSQDQPDKPPKKHTKPEVKIQLSVVAEEIAQGNISDDDAKGLMDSVADAISKEIVAPRVGTKVATAVKKTMKKGVKPEPKPVDNFHRLQKHAMSLQEGLQMWADQTMNQPENREEKEAAAIVRNAACSIIVNYARLGIDVIGIYETFYEGNDNEKAIEQSSSRIIDVTPN